MSFRLVGFILLALAPSACGKGSTPTAPTSSTPVSPASVRVSGRVVDYDTGRSIPGYAVRWWTGSGSHLIIRVGTLDSVSDADGRFTVDVPVTDDFTPLTDTLLFDTPVGSGSIRIPAKSIETDLIVNPGGCNVRYGYVYDAVTHRPIAGARVVRRSSAITDGNGFYRIEIVCDAPAGQSWGIGTTTIGASHPAYQSAFEFDGRSEYTGHPGIRRVDFALQPLQ
jgi:hypothetical protein